MPDQPNFAAGLGITVAGGGISGLAVAAAFARRGAHVTVHEQAPELAEVGAGLQISPNGVAVLDALGLADAARDTGLHLNAIELRDGLSGRIVTRMDLSDGPRPYMAFHRADLLSLLERAAREHGVDIRLGQHMSGDAAPAPPLLVAADGVHSQFRTRLNGPVQPFFTGQIAWRALVPLSTPVPAQATVHMGPQAHVVTYPLRGGSMLNIVAVEERDVWTDADWNLAGDPDEMRALFAQFGRDVRDILAQVEQVKKWGLFRYPVARHWQTTDAQPIAMIGDAAHPTLPFLAQGANMALEDAWVLAAEVDRLGIETGLPRFESLRKPRATRAIETANANARNYHLSNPLIRNTAHLGLSTLGRIAPNMMLRRFDWLYNHDVTTG